MADPAPAASLPLRRPRALLFDWDNTLVDNWSAIHEALNAALTAMGHSAWSYQETRERVRASMRDSFPRLFGDRWPEAGRIFYETFAARHLERLSEMPGAGAMIAELAGRGFYLAVVSNKQGRFLRAEAERLGWLGHFGRVVGAGDAARDKPAIEPVELALEPAGIARGGEVWFVGDTDIDIRCAAAAGCVPVLLRPEPPGALEFAEQAPALHLPDCQALAATLRQL